MAPHILEKLAKITEKGHKCNFSSMHFWGSFGQTAQKSCSGFVELRRDTYHVNLERNLRKGITAQLN